MLFTLLGLVNGSFLNVVIYRLPAQQSLNGRSACPKCGHQIRWYDNIPVVSWVLLRAKCRDCKAPISVRYPLVEAGHAIMWGGLAAWLGYTNPLLPLLLFFSSVSLALALIDIDTFRLPDILTLPLLGITTTYLAALSAYQHTWHQFWVSQACAGAFLVFYLTLFLVTKGGGLGFGDVKLAPVLGMLTGWFGVGAAAVGFMGAFLPGIPLGILMALRIVKRGTAVPFGPMLIGGAWLGILFGQPLAAAYLTLLN